MLRIRTALWLQNPPRVEWVLRVIAETDTDSVCLRTWFKEYAADHKPPREVVDRIAARMRSLAVAMLEGGAEERDYSIEVSI